MIDVLLKAADYGRSLGATYAELRAESINRSNIQYEDGRVRTISQRIEEGAAIRVLARGAWGFVSSSDLSLSALKASVKDAYSLAARAGEARQDPIKLAELRPVHDTVKMRFAKSPADVNPQEKIAYAEKLWAEARRLDKRMSAVTVRLRDCVGKKYIATSDGTELDIGLGHVHLWSWLTGKEGAKLTGARDECGSTVKGWEYFDEDQPAPKVAERLVARVQKQLKGVKPKAGTFACVLGPEIVGTLAHEALGHLSEADLTLQSAFAGKLGQQVAPKSVNMIDDGTLAGAFGTEKYDDEGAPTSRVELIKDGVLNGLLTDREYAQRMGLPVSGNARAEDYRVAPLIRMHNTFFERGDRADDELFEDIDFGYYCLSVAGGQAQTNASFQVGIQEAFEIVKGKVGQPVTNVSISGIATDALMKIEAIGKEKFALDQGRCGKGQEALVGSGGPLIHFGKGPIAFGGKEQS